MPNELNVTLALPFREMPASGVGSHVATLVHELKRHEVLRRLHLLTFSRPAKPLRGIVRAYNRILDRYNEGYWQELELKDFCTQLCVSPDDVVHCHGEPALWAVGGKVKSSGGRLVGTIHGLNSLHILEQYADTNVDGRDTDAFRWYDRIEREGILYADHMIAVDSNHKRLLIERGYPASQISVIHNAVDMDYVDRFANEPAPIPLDNFILASRRLEPKNGVDILIRALGLMRHRIPAVIVGHGGREAELRELVSRLGLASRVIFLGKQPRSIVMRLTWNATVCVIPSVPRGGTIEATSLSAIEAMAARRLVVASDIGGLQEIISNGITGLLVPAADPTALADALDNALSDRKLRARIAESARSNVLQRLTTAQWTGKHLALYSSLLSRGSICRNHGSPIGLLP